jgi:2-(1,2-epoxy-1,2-dihydrophenyl)acetyl-CoA isomerase
MSEILFEKRNGVGIITLNRPDVLNSFNKAMAMAMQEKLDDCAGDDEVRCILIQASGRAFCAGQDLQEAISSDGPTLRSIVKDHYNPIIIKIRGIEKPVVAAVNGVAAGAGANIALACDITIASESACFIQAFSKIGLIPDSGGTFTLPRLVGMQRATALMMLGDKVSASEAESMGMIYKAVADADFAATVEQLSTKLAAMPTYGLGLTKRALNLSLSNELGQQLDVEEELQNKAGQSHDYKEGVNAFLEKRKPNFTGKK